MKKGRENKPHIGIFGRRNNGKSSLINALAGQDIAIVSGTPGTTTDPVKKSVEIFGIGPVILIDTAGIDDEGDLGILRVRKSMQAIKSIDLAVIVVTDNNYGTYEKALIDQFKRHGIPFFFVHNKSDRVAMSQEFENSIKEEYNARTIAFSCAEKAGLDALLDALVKAMPKSSYTTNSLLGNLLEPGDIVMLITPIDLEAPEGRMILPQVQAIRDVLDNDCVNIVLKETEVENFLKNTGIKPKLAITDSQMFQKMDGIVPDDIPLTGFSVLLASRKGDFETYIQGTPRIGDLKDGDRVLILESCTHQVNCDDIGRYKIPGWLKDYTGKDLRFDVVAGLDEYPRPVKDYALVVQCGGCMITRKQLKSRLLDFKEANIPITNYGMAIAYTNGIYERAMAPFIG
ncbi:MAG: [FeFe] hydrogenase H-cluster maturation GTPase HydF [Bacteroidales bacterium]|jgi:[FeFe] hydrogenase H-cluster maturation GTPase HydF|nr:[FeFe] hydrogenase H-cluster maturation GTPase HydF [Bacteroidales bacterium]